jgi:hypothetical protein
MTNQLQMELYHKLTEYTDFYEKIGRQFGRGRVRRYKILTKQWIQIQNNKIEMHFQYKILTIIAASLFSNELCLRKQNH